MDIDRQVAHWRDGANDDWDTAQALLGVRKWRQCLFFAHLAVEKALKAHVCRTTGELAPRIHNLVRLAELAGVAPDGEQLDLLADLSAYNMEGRYPELLGPAPDSSEATRQMDRTDRVLKWLLETL